MATRKLLFDFWCLRALPYINKSAAEREGTNSKHKLINAKKLHVPAPGGPIRTILMLCPSAVDFFELPLGSSSLCSNCFTRAWRSAMSWCSSSLVGAIVVIYQLRIPDQGNAKTTQSLRRSGKGGKLLNPLSSRIEVVDLGRPSPVIKLRINGDLAPKRRSLGLLLYLSRDNSWNTIVLPPLVLHEV